MFTALGVMLTAAMFLLITMHKHMHEQTNKQTTTWTQTHSQHLTAVHSAHQYPQLNRLEILHFIWSLTPCKKYLVLFVLQ